MIRSATTRSRPRPASCGATAAAACGRSRPISAWSAPASRAISAALEAAALGRKVVLVDGLHALGGQAVNSVIGTFCGLFSNGTAATRPCTASPTASCAISAPRARCIYRHGGPSNTTVVMYDEVALARWIEEQVRAAGITVLLGAVMREVDARRAAHPRDRSCDALWRRARQRDRLRRGQRRRRARLECRACLPRGRRRTDLRHPDGGDRGHRRGASAGPPAKSPSG